MKLNISLKKQEGTLEADVEGIVKKSLEYKSKRPPAPPKKTRYQIRQEEKRKNEELKMKKMLIFGGIAVGLLAVILIICFIGAAVSA